MREEFNEFQDTSKTYEAEIEYELEALNDLNGELQRENKRLREELRELKTVKLVRLLQESEKSREEAAELREAHESALKYYRGLETELEVFYSKVRQRDFELKDLREKYSQTLEELALTCCELENVKFYSYEAAKKTRSDMRTTQKTWKHRPSQSISSSMAGQDAVSMIDHLIESLACRLSSK